MKLHDTKNAGYENGGHVILHVFTARLLIR